MKMVESINVHGLAHEDIKFVEKIVNLLRDKAIQNEIKKGSKYIEFVAWPSDVKGKITREEIYDRL